MQKTRVLKYLAKIVLTVLHSGTQRIINYKNMKIDLKLQDFFNYSGIDYKEDMYDMGIYYEQSPVALDQLIDNLPAKYAKKFTVKQLENNQDLTDALTEAYYNADYDSEVNACLAAQKKAVEKYANKMVDYINKINDATIKSIRIDWDNRKAIIDVNAKNALITITDIINGEGIFRYNNFRDFAMSMDGKYNPSSAIKNHMHYLLNVKLIKDIWGFDDMPRWEWEVNYWEIDKELYADQIVNCLTPEQLKMSQEQLQAIYYAKQSKIHKEKYIEFDKLFNDIYIKLKEKEQREVAKLI